jgi:F-type H+-transporting ATPase subunit b
MKRWAAIAAGVLAYGPVALAQEGHGGGASPFAGTIYQSVAAVAVFLLLLLILAKYAWGPILAGLQARENKIRNDLEEAEASARQAAQTLRQHEEKLAAAQAEALKIIEQGRADALKVGAQLRADAQAEMDQIRRRAEADIRSAKQQAINELYSETATLSTQIAEKILRRQMNPEDHGALIQQALAELAQKQRP